MIFREWLIVELKKKKYTYSSVQVELPENLAHEIISWGKRNITDQEIYQNLGREDDIHVTALYGIHASSPKSTIELLTNFAKFEIKLGKISVFKNSDFYDVVKISVESSKLHQLNKQLKKLDYTNSYPKYVPHVTIAYVKKGKGEKFVGNSYFSGKHFISNQVIFSSRNGRKTKN